MIRVSRVVGPAVLLLVAFAALLAALAFGGGAEVPAAINPGQLVLWGLPIANLLVILSISGLVGSLLLAIFAFSPEQPEYVRALDVASASSAVLTVSAALTAFLNMQAVDPEPVTFDTAFGTTLANFLTGNALGQAWLWTTIVGAVATVAFFLVRNQTVVGILTIGAVLSLIPMALQGHAGDTASHDAATTSIYLHIVFAAIWLGGLLTLLLCRRQLDGGRLVVVLSRYSTIALICFVVVGISGIVGADVRIGTWENLLTPYGILVLVKVFALGALGIFGIFQRRFLIARIGGAVTGAARYFWFFVAGELAFMGLASGTAVALSRTVDPENPLPASQLDNPTAAELLTGSHLPAPPTIERYLTGLNPDLVWVLIVGFAVFFYLAGVWRLHKRGDSWPVHRTVLWLLGMLVLLYVTCGGVNVYEKFLFSAHMIAHMVLTMAIPVFLVPSAPVTLALRTINKRDDGSRGAREWILLLVQSKLFGFLSRPLVAAILFASSLWIFYYTPLFSWASTDHVGHEWMIFHFLIVGYLFVSSLIGVDPSPHRVAYPMRLLILLATMAFHAFFGLALITSTGLLSADWYGAMGWGPSIPAIQDQQLAGGIAWSIGEIPTLSLAIIVAIMWSRSDARESKRYDRKAERDNDAELNAYNEMLARRARQS